MRRVFVSPNYYAKVDDADFPLVSQYRWHANHSHNGVIYATTSADGKTIYMHRLVMDAQPGDEIDHINSDGLDNQRSCNLQKCSHNLNIHRGRKSKMRGDRPVTSQYKGVCWYPRHQRWLARFRNKHIGYFDTPELAARAYNAAAAAHYGPLALLNPLPAQAPA